MKDFSQDIVNHILKNLNIIKTYDICTNCKNLKNKIKSSSTYNKKNKTAYLGHVEEFNFNKKSKLKKEDFNHLFEYYMSYGEHYYVCEKCLTSFTFYESDNNDAQLSFLKFKSLTPENFSTYFSIFTVLYKKYFKENYYKEIKNFTEPITVYGVYTKQLLRNNHKELLNLKYFNQDDLDWINIEHHLSSFKGNGFGYDFFKNTYLLKMKVKPYHVFLDDKYSDSDINNTIDFIVNKRDVSSIEIYNPTQNTWVKSYRKTSESDYRETMIDKFTQWETEMLDSLTYTNIINQYSNYIDLLISHLILNKMNSLYPNEFKLIVDDIITRNNEFEKFVKENSQYAKNLFKDNTGLSEEDK